MEMICADFLAGANLDHGDPEMLLFSMTRFFKFLQMCIRDRCRIPTLHEVGRKGQEGRHFGIVLLQGAD